MALAHKHNEYQSKLTNGTLGKNGELLGELLLLGKGLDIAKELRTGYPCERVLDTSLDIRVEVEF